MKEEEDGYQLCVRENLSHLFHKLIRQQKSISNCNQTFHRNHDIRTQIMLEFIHRNYAENITLTDIADAASISISEALRCFHNIIGIPPIKYLKKYRLSRADKKGSSLRRTLFHSRTPQRSCCEMRVMR